MRARVGDLAIAKFDNPGRPDGKQWHEVLCLVIEHHVFSQYPQHERMFKFVYWTKNGRGTEVQTDSLPVGRFRRVRLKRGRSIDNIGNLTLDDIAQNVERVKNVKRARSVSRSRSSSLPPMPVTRYRKLCVRRSTGHTGHCGFGRKL